MSLKSYIVHLDFWQEKAPKILGQSIGSFPLPRPNEFFGFCGIAWPTAIFLVIGSFSQRENGWSKEAREGGHDKSQKSEGN